MHFTTMSYAVVSIPWKPSGLVPVMDAVRRPKPIARRGDWTPRCPALIWQIKE